MSENRIFERPTDAEYAPFYAGYVSLVPEVDVLTVLEAQVDEIRRMAASVPADRETFRYASGKWSVREVFGHLADSERVFGYRAFSIARGNEGELPGFDENASMTPARFDRRPLASLVEEMAAVRTGSLLLFRHLEPEDWARMGTANGSPVSVRALAFMAAGHVRHHLGVLRERYGVG
jgi:hypothetical protein